MRPPKLMAWSNHAIRLGVAKERARGLGGLCLLAGSRRGVWSGDAVRDLVKTLGWSRL